MKPRESEPAVRRVLAAREVRANLEALRALGAEVRYLPVDVRDPIALAAAVASIRADWGHIDLVVHGAGVIEDKRIADKSPESFARVYGTKVPPARALLEAVGPEVKRVIFFASIAGATGNVGQVDYAAANDALDVLARTTNGPWSGRLLSVDWGPWSGAGMVSPALAALYAERGIILMDPDAAVAALMDELADGRATQVVLSSVPPSAFAQG